MLKATHPHPGPPLEGEGEEQQRPALTALESDISMILESHGFSRVFVCVPQAKAA
jgi:hypothetical protein